MLRDKRDEKYRELEKRGNFLFDDLKYGGELGGLRRKLYRWSEFRKPSLREVH